MVRSDENWTPESDGLLDILSFNHLEVPSVSVAGYQLIEKTMQRNNVTSY
jgi:hypothetical protein